MSRIFILGGGGYKKVDTHKKLRIYESDKHFGGGGCPNSLTPAYGLDEKKIILY